MLSPMTAAERLVADYHRTQELLPLAGGIPQPIDRCDDNAIVTARGYLSLYADVTEVEERIRRGDLNGPLAICDALRAALNK